MSDRPKHRVHYTTRLKVPLSSRSVVFKKRKKKKKNVWTWTTPPTRPLPTPPPPGAWFTTPGVLPVARVVRSLSRSFVRFYALYSLDLRPILAQLSSEVYACAVYAGSMRFRRWLVRLFVHRVPRYTRGLYGSDVLVVERRLLKTVSS